MIIKTRDFSPIHWAISSLTVTALLGVVLRYKIAFPLPWIHQKHLLHAHSHFAFSGWVSQMIMTLLVIILAVYKDGSYAKKFTVYLKLNLMLAYCMLVSFAMQGYGNVSIFFSALSIVLSYVFGLKVLRGMSGLKETAFYYFRAAIFSNILSSVGVYWMAFMMTRGVPDQNNYLAALYFFLHFQYNGWFIFSVLGMLNMMLASKGVEPSSQRKVFWGMLLTLVPAYFLSTLWAALPIWLYILTCIAAITQFIVWCIFMYQFFQADGFSNLLRFKPLTRFVLYLVMMSFFIKFFLQLLSVVPVLGQFAFGIRPIVIAYLHLVMLLIVSGFLLAFLYESGFFTTKRITHVGIILFLTSALLNEILLVLQGINYIVPFTIGVTNEMLFGVAVLMFSGTCIISLSVYRKKIAEPVNGLHAM